jgi:hypothetical protein
MTSVQMLIRVIPAPPPLVPYAARKFARLPRRTFGRRLKPCC